MSNYFVLAYYYLTPISDPIKEVLSYKNFFKNKDIKGRIYISTEGVNAQISCHAKEKESLLKFLDKKCADINSKEDPADEHAFYKMIIKERKQLVAFGREVDFSKKGEHVSPKDWKEMLENKDENTVVLDVRNSYEWKVGHFTDAELFPCETFREFPEYTEKLQKNNDPKKTKVMMYCTGGIRCEYYSAYLREKGFENIYQLDGGVIQYGKKMGTKHWEGQLFVFDDRLVVPINEDEPAKVVSKCHTCDKESTTYYNCANMDCNALFLSCIECAEENKGCCSNVCLETGRIRPYCSDTKPKPFRKLSSEKKNTL